MLDGALEQSLFESKQRALLLEQAALEQKLNEIDSGSDTGIAQLEKTVELAKNAPFLYKMASVENKRKLLKILLSNLTVSGKNVENTLQIPFQIIAQRQKNDECGLNRGTCRTWEGILQELCAFFAKKLGSLIDSP